MPVSGHGLFSCPETGAFMAFDGLLHWLEKNHGKHEKTEQPADTLPDITSEGGVTLPPISGGVPDGE
jgi:hypothetical protein